MDIPLAAAGPSIALWEATARVLLAMALAGAVGAERELRDQEAGLRTHILVGVGAALFVIVGNYSWVELSFGNQTGVVLDPSRVVAYVITGIGFLGAGAIIKHGTTVRGVTTAATLWLAAALGVAAGAGLYVTAAFGVALVIVVLVVFRRLEPLVVDRAGPPLHALVVDYERGHGTLGPLIRRCESVGGLRDVRLEDDREDGRGPGHRRARLTVATDDLVGLERVVDDVRSRPEVSSVQLSRQAS